MNIDWEKVGLSIQNVKWAQSIQTLGGLHHRIGPRRPNSSSLNFDLKNLDKLISVKKHK
jgi:nucleoside-specific outer membrane channel protein Tsx